MPCFDITVRNDDNVHVYEIVQFVVDKSPFLQALERTGQQMKDKRQISFSECYLPLDYCPPWSEWEFALSIVNGGRRMIDRQWDPEILLIVKLICQRFLMIEWFVESHLLQKVTHPLDYFISFESTDLTLDIKLPSEVKAFGRAYHALPEGMRREVQHYILKHRQADENIDLCRSILERLSVTNEVVPVWLGDLTMFRSLVGCTVWPSLEPGVTWMISHKQDWKTIWADLEEYAYGLGDRVYCHKGLTSVEIYTDHWSVKLMKNKNHVCFHPITSPVEVHFGPRESIAVFTSFEYLDLKSFPKVEWSVDVTDPLFLKELNLKCEWPYVINVNSVNTNKIVTWPTHRILFDDHIPLDALTWRQCPPTGTTTDKDQRTYYACFKSSQTYKQLVFSHQNMKRTRRAISILMNILMNKEYMTEYKMDPAPYSHAILTVTIPHAFTYHLPSAPPSPSSKRKRDEFEGPHHGIYDEWQSLPVKWADAQQ